MPARSKWIMNIACCISVNNYCLQGVHQLWLNRITYADMRHLKVPDDVDSGESTHCNWIHAKIHRQMKFGQWTCSCWSTPPAQFSFHCQYPYVSSTNAATATGPDFHFRPSSPRFELGGRVAMGVREVPVDWLVDRYGDLSNPPGRSPSADLPAAAADPSRRRLVRRRVVRRQRCARPIYSCAQQTGSVGSHRAGIRRQISIFNQRSGVILCTAAPSLRLAASFRHALFE